MGQEGGTGVPITLLLWRVGLLCRWDVYRRDWGVTEIGCEEKWLMEPYSSHVWD